MATARPPRTIWGAPTINGHSAAEKSKLSMGAPVILETFGPLKAAESCNDYFVSPSNPAIRAWRRLIFILQAPLRRRQKPRRWPPLKGRLPRVAARREVRMHSRKSWGVTHTPGGAAAGRGR